MGSYYTTRPMLSNFVSLGDKMVSQMSGLVSQFNSSCMSQRSYCNAASGDYEHATLQSSYSRSTSGEVRMRLRVELVRTIPQGMIVFSCEPGWMMVSRWIGGWVDKWRMDACMHGWTSLVDPWHGSAQACTDPIAWDYPGISGACDCPLCFSFQASLTLSSLKDNQVEVTLNVGLLLSKDEAKQKWTSQHLCLQPGS